MSIQLKKIFEETKEKYELNLIAGDDGLDSIMYWLYIAEDPDNVAFFRSGELVITTGVLIRNDSDALLRFIKTLKTKDTCGLIINTGKYINREEIPDTVINYCNKNNFPLLTMPWHIHIYDISRDYYNRIFYDSTKDDDLSNALHNICNDAKPATEYRTLLEKHNLNPEQTYRLSIINLLKNDGSNFDMKTIPDYAYYLNLLRFSFIRHNFTGHLFLDGSLIIVVAKDITSNNLRILLSDIESRLPSSKNYFTYHIGISDVAVNMSILPVAYNHALYALRFATATKVSHSFYDDLGVLKLIYEIKDVSVIEKYVHDKLGKVLDYDSQHNTALKDTLKSYLLNQGNISAVASECFCHRNTVSNRIELLTNELDLHIEDRKERFELMVALFLRDHTFMT